MAFEIIAQPVPEWFRAKSDTPLRFPTLIYRRVDRLDDPPSGTVMGASWSVLCDRGPWFAARRAIFEDLYFPYRFPGLHLRVRHAILLWPRINLSAYTLLADPRRVYVRDANGVYVAEFYFADDHIRLTEVTTR